MRRSSPFVTGIVFIFVGILLAGFGVFAVMEEKKILETGTETNATIIDKGMKKVRRHERNRTKEEEVHYVIVAFNDTANQQRQITRNIAVGEWKEYEQGQTVPVKYIPTNPSELRLGKELQKDPMQTGYILGGLGAVFAVIGLISMFFGNRRRVM